VADVIWVGMYDSKFQVLMTTSPTTKVKKQNGKTNGGIHWIKKQISHQNFARCFASRTSDSEQPAYLMVLHQELKP
jgi:hypothetical protein